MSLLSESSQEPRYLDVAQRMQLLHLSDAAGVVYWQPAGLRLYERLRSYIREVHEEHGYQEVKTPALVSMRLFEQSGHLAKYRENMFLANQSNELHSELDMQQYALRPMSCPNHIELYRHSLRSYRELPLALFEFGEVFRNEPSGSLQVLFRQRQFCQDDSHVFVTQDGVQDGVRNYLEMARRVYRELGFEKVEVNISLRPEKRFGSDADWERAEESLRKACRDLGLEFGEEPGGGAFYGPKIELGVKDKLGRTWQMGVVQLDYVLPERFGLSYVAADGAAHTPVLLHHAVLGSLERMIGTLLETFGSQLPEALHPYPWVLVPVSDDKHLAFAQAVARMLREEAAERPWVEVESSADPVAAKVRKWKTRGALRVQLLGERELQLGVEAVVVGLLQVRPRP